MSDGRLVLESKDEMKKRGIPSPDKGTRWPYASPSPEGRRWSPTDFKADHLSERRACLMRRV